MFTYKYVYICLSLTNTPICCLTFLLSEAFKNSNKKNRNKFRGSSFIIHTPNKICYVTYRANTFHTFSYRYIRILFVAQQRFVQKPKKQKPKFAIEKEANANLVETKFIQLFVCFIHSLLFGEKECPLFLSIYLNERHQNFE